MDTLKVLVVEDNDVFRQFVRNTLEDEIGAVEVSEIPDGLAAFQLALEIKPDLIILDIALPSLNGLEVAKRILESSPATKILFLSQESSKDIVREGFRIGARGYVVKSDAGGELRTALRAVLKGDRFVSRQGGWLDFRSGLKLLV
jgi:two-component system, NarL family, response regulator NreC